MSVDSTMCARVRAFSNGSIKQMVSPGIKAVCDDVSPLFNGFDFNFVFDFTTFNVFVGRYADVSFLGKKKLLK